MNIKRAEIIMIACSAFIPLCTMNAFAQSNLPPAFQNPPPAFNQNAGYTSQDDIQLIEGEPNQQFVKLQPIMARGEKMDNVVRELRRSAYKLRADAIINFKVESKKREYIGGKHSAQSGELGTSRPDASELSAAGSTSTGGFYGESRDEIVLTGWAIQWTKNPSDQSQSPADSLNGPVAPTSVPSGGVSKPNPTQ